MPPRCCQHRQRCALVRVRAHNSTEAYRMGRQGLQGRSAQRRASGDRPSGSAPQASSRRSVSRRPAAAAHCAGVRPAHAPSMSADSRSSRRSRSTFPAAAARCSACPPPSRGVRRRRAGQGLFSSTDSKAATGSGASSAHNRSSASPQGWMSPPSPAACDAHF